MTTHTITTFVGAYALNAGVTQLSITPVGAILGATDATPSAPGQDALTDTLDAGVLVDNSGAIRGGIGAGGTVGAAGHYTGGNGGNGGAGGTSSVAWSVQNYGTVQGGYGGAGGAGSGPSNGGAGGFGGVGLSLGAGGYVYNGGLVAGGLGGGGGYAFVYDGPAHAGGAGLVGVGGVSIVNAGTISGGAGGAGVTGHFYGGASGGAGGGAGVSLTGTVAAAVFNYALITGGIGGESGVGEQYSGNAGNGGDGIDFATGLLVNKGTVKGGDGAEGGGGVNSGGHGGAGGAAISTTAVASINNSGMLQGGAGGMAGAISSLNGAAAGGGAGGAGIVFAFGGSILNSGTVTGGDGGVGADGPQGAGSGGQGGAGGNGGAGVLISGGGVLTNLGRIHGALGGSGGHPGYVNAYYGPAGARADGVDVTAGGSVVNGNGTTKAIIDGAIGVYASGTVAATVTNWGEITGYGDYSVMFKSASDRLIVEAGSTLVKLASGGSGTLELAGGAGTINSLDLIGTLSVGAVGSFTGFNGYVVDAGASWTLAGVNLLSSNQSLVDFGSVLVAGYLNSSGTISGAAGAGGVYATLGGSAGATAIDLAGGSIVNHGLITGGGGGNGFSDGFHAGSGGAGGVGVDPASGALSNYGTILGGTGGQGGGSFPTSDPGGAGGAAIVQSGAATILNHGLIKGGAGGAGGLGEGAGAGGNGAAGVSLLGGGRVTNDSTIMGGAGGANEGAAAHGLAGDGVDLASGGTVVNGYSAQKNHPLIYGRIGVYGGGGAAVTVTNYATIQGTGGTSVKFANTGDRLIAENSSSFVGTVAGGGGTLELAAGTGSIDGLGGIPDVISGAVSATISNFGTYQLDVGGAWTLFDLNSLASGKRLISNAQIALAAGASLSIHDKATATVRGVVSNGGAITIASTGDLTDLNVQTAGATLSGGGGVTMSGTKARIVGATAASTLTNADNTISGTGFIGANSLTLINQSKGVIDAIGAAGLTVGTKGSTLTNQGLMEATGGGILIIANTTVANLGGTILATNGSPVDLQDDVVRGGGITASGTGVVKVNVAGGELDGTTNAVSLSGVAFIVNGSNETLEGSIANAGKINLIASTSTSDLIIGAAGANLSGGGQVNMTNSLKNRIYGLASGDTLTNVDNRIDGAGVLGNGVMTLTNDAKGQIVGNQNLALTIDTGTNTIVNAGLIENVGKGGTLVKSAVNNTGTLLAATAGTLNFAGAVTGAGVGQIAGGTLYVQLAFAENVTFSGSTGVLELGDSQAFTGTVTGLSKTGTSWLDLVDIGFFASKTKATYSGTTASGTLTVTDGTHTAHISLIGNYLSSTWTVSGDGHGGTKVVDPSGGSAPLAQAIASFQSGPPPHLAEIPAYRLPRFPILHARA